MSVSIVVAGGYSAGHIEPALSVADPFRSLKPDAVVTALGTVRGLETRLIPGRGYPLELIPPVPLPRRRPTSSSVLAAALRCRLPGRPETKGGDCGARSQCPSGNHG